VLFEENAKRVSAAVNEVNDGDFPDSLLEWHLAMPGIFYQLPLIETHRICFT